MQTKANRGVMSIFILSVGVGLAIGVLSGCTTAPAENTAIRHYVTTGDAEALAELIAYDTRGMTKLPPAYILEQLRDRETESNIDQAFLAVLADDTPTARASLIKAVELDFVKSANTSSLDLLGADLSDKFRSFAWDRFDYPGGTEGPNEASAMTLADALDAVTPERRANRAAVAVIVRDEATDDLWEYMLDQWRDVPGEDEKKLNQHAVPAYLAMREAAAADGVALVILSGHRDPKRAAANAARAGNSFAVASFSSHSLGLAIDLVLPRPHGDIAEREPNEPSNLGDQGDAWGRFQLTTRPMAAVVDMRRSPVHKWLHLYGHEFGWYPFQHEPWHWEYNPPGFRKVFFSDWPDGPPLREAAP
ncbi:MAG: hypothetical protein AAGF84_00820 [Planctomycetota bacterium]